MTPAHIFSYVLIAVAAVAGILVVWMDGVREAERILRLAERATERWAQEQRRRIEAEAALAALREQVARRWEGGNDA